jgi:hypothetical protein
MNTKNINLYNIFWICHKILGTMSIIYFLYMIYFTCTFFIYNNTEGVCINNHCTFPTLSIYNYNNCYIQTPNINKEAYICYYCIKIHDYIYVSATNNGCINLYDIALLILYYFTIPTIIKLIFFYNYKRIANKILLYDQSISININTLYTPLLSNNCYLCLQPLNDLYIPMDCSNNNIKIIIRTYCNHYYCYNCMLRWKDNNCTHCPKCLNTIFL